MEDPRLKLFPNQSQDRRPLLFLKLLDLNQNPGLDEAQTEEFKTFFGDWKNFINTNKGGLTGITQDPSVLAFGDFKPDGKFYFDTAKIGHNTAIVFGGLFDDASPDFMTSNSAFSSYKWDAFIRKRLFDIANAEIENPPNNDSVPYAQVASSSHNIIGYDGDYTKNGKPYGRNDGDTATTFSMASKCFNTGLNLSDGQCKDLMNALISDDPALLDNFLQTVKSIPDFGKVANDELVNMHPVLALRMLQKFGFKKTREYDSVAGMDLWKVENVKHWLKNYMSERFSSEDIRKMLTQPGQNYILQYLDLVADFVNSNPSILNHSYSGPTTQVNATFAPSTYATRLGIAPELPRVFTLNGTNMKRLDSYFKSQVYAHKRPFDSGLNMSTTSYFPGQYFVGGGSPFATKNGMYGGGSGKCATIYRRLGANNGITAGQMISNAIDDLRKELRARGQQLSPSDDKNLNARIKQYIDLEDSLLKTVCMVEEYLNWTSVSDAFDGKPAILNENNIKKVNDRMQKMFDRRGNDDRKINEILIRIYDALDKDGKYTNIY